MLIQLLIMELLQKTIAQIRAGEKYEDSVDQTQLVRSYEGAVCGSVAGGIAAALTTPLDVVKTRLMLGSVSEGLLMLICLC